MPNKRLVWPAQSKSLLTRLLAFHSSLEHLMAVPSGALVLEPSQQRYGHDGAWSTFAFGVGDPEQTFQLLPSLTGSQFWIPDPSIDCEQFKTYSFDSRADCIADRGGPGSSIGLAASQSKVRLGLSSLEAYPSFFNDSTSGNFYSDNVSISTSHRDQPVEVANQTVAGIAADEFWIGIFGLGINVTTFSKADGNRLNLLASLKRQDIIGSLSFGYTSGAANGPESASLILGGYDSARSDRNVTLPINDDRKTLPLRVWEILTENSLLDGVASLLSETADIDILLDSSTSQLWLPDEVCQRFAAAFALQYDPGHNLYWTNTSMHHQLQGQNPSVTITVGSRTSKSQSVDIEMHYADFDLILGNPYYPDDIAYFPIRNATAPDQYVLGRAFLQKAYVVVDWERKNFTIGRLANKSSISVEAIPSIEESTTEAHLTAGGIAGITIACVFVMLAAAMAFLVFRRRKQQERDRKHSILAPTIDTIETLGTGTLVNTDIMSETASCRKKRLDSGASELPEDCRGHELGSKPILEMEGDQVMPEPDKEEQEQQNTAVEREPSVHELA